ncbi:MAG: PilZ domain-containing protein [Candidatus Omnitrophota bacterium]|jgi:hypothetical protein|nr:MAG: PilZ domain-containing protein [Candidatus Omnitrophota bacterium]
MNKTGKERRQYPRVTATLPFRVIANGYDFATSTENVSCIGAYCHVDKYIPPFTKVAVDISLPPGNKRLKKNAPLKCTGVIVRTEDDTNGGFKIAIFFNDIKDEQKKKISEYLSHFYSNPS